jgi:hypothetical protein
LCMWLFFFSLLCCVWLGAVHKFSFELLQSEHSTNGSQWRVTDAVTQIYVLTGPLCFFYKGTYPKCWGQNFTCHLRSVELMGRLYPYFCVASSMNVFVCYVATCNNANSTVTFYVFYWCTLGCIVIVLLDVVVTNRR